MQDDRLRRPGFWRRFPYYPSRHIILLAALTIHVALLGWFSSSGIDLGDEGQQFGELVRMSQGQTPFRDFMPMYTSPVKYLHAMVLANLGGGIVLIRRFNIVLIITIAGISYGIARPLLPEAAASVAAILGIAGLGFPLYTYNHLVATLFLLLAVRFTVAAWRASGESTSLGLTVGLLVGLTTVVHWPMGVTLLGGLLVSTLVVRPQKRFFVAVLTAAALITSTGYFGILTLRSGRSLQELLFPILAGTGNLSPPPLLGFFDIFTRLPTSADALNRMGLRIRNYLPLIVVCSAFVYVALKRRGHDRDIVTGLTIIQGFLLGKWILGGVTPALRFVDQISFVLFVVIIWNCIPVGPRRLRRAAMSIAAAIVACIYITYAAPWTLARVAGSQRDDRPVTVQGERLYVDAQVGSFLEEFRSFFGEAGTRANCCAFFGSVPLLHYIAGYPSPLDTDRIVPGFRGFDSAAGLRDALHRLDAAGVRWLGIMRQPPNSAWQDNTQVLERVLRDDYKLVREIRSRPADNENITEYRMEIFERQPK